MSSWVEHRWSYSRGRFFICLGMDYRSMLFCVDVDNGILILVFNTYFTVLINFWYIYMCIYILLQVTMVATRNSRSFIPSVTTRKIGAKNAKQKIYLHICGVIFVLNQVIARYKKKLELVNVLGLLKMIVNLIKKTLLLYSGPLQ